jgi:predicted RNase H-like HicB family nuclease
MKKTVGVLLVEDGGHWAARSADVLDIYAVGKTREQACERLQEALTAHLDVLRERSLPMPEFTALVDTTTFDQLDQNER